jgi:methylmalonyl-CoA mutase
MSSEKLFNDFKAVTKAEWKQKTIQDLKGADFEENLYSELEKGFEVASFYNQEDLENLSYLQKYHQQNLNVDVKQEGARHWYNQPLITVINAKKANKQALEALGNGADAILFDIKNEKIELSELLKGILLEHCFVSFRVQNNTLEFLTTYVEYLQNTKTDLTAVNGSLFASWADTEELQERIKITRTIPEFYPIVHSENSSLESSTEKIADVLTRSVQTIQSLLTSGLEADEIIKNSQFSISVDNRYFLSIAKIKALKMLFNEVSEAFLGTNITNLTTKIHAFSHIEQGANHKNIISNSTQAMSAILGGCDLLTIVAHDLGEESVTNEEFSLRIARNISTILREESYLDKIVDPVAGSYYIENLIDTFAEKTWTLFQEKIG